MKNEYESENHKLFFKDAKIIQNGLATLQNCSELFPNHETFEDGYKIKLLFKNLPSNDYFISVYRQNNSQDKRRHSVMPHLGKTRNLNLGNYHCIAFQKWVKENIDPLFNDKFSD